MKCPYCNSSENRVIDSRVVQTESAIRRRRECGDCQRRFTTYEYVESTPITVVKIDNRREPYSRKKIEKSINIACNKRPVSMEQIATLVNEVELEISNLSRREIPSKVIGESLMKHLKNLDQVAYVRFASVYRKFEDAEEFIQEIHRMD